MPKRDVDYSNTFFYKIVCRDLSITDLYVGHTTNFIIRRYSHKNKTIRGNNIYLYQFIRDNGGWENWDMVLIEQTACINRLEALKKEREFIELLQASLNKQTPSRTNKEWFEENKDILAEKSKQYRNGENREIILERKKKFYSDNKKKILEDQKQYQKVNRDKLIEYRQTKITCNCGATFSRSNKAQHERTEKHNKYINSKNL